MPDAAFIECSRCRQHLSAAQVPQRCPGCGAEFYAGNDQDGPEASDALDREAGRPRRSPVGGIITPQ